MAGWLKIHRKIKEHWLWQDADKLKWWLDVLMEANHEDRKVLLKGSLVECKRGQCVKSLETWAKDWRTTKKTVSSFFNLLQKDGMILAESIKVSTRLTICNYESYQSEGNTEYTQSKRKVNAEYTQPTPKQEGKELKEGKEFKNNGADAQLPEGDFLDQGEQPKENIPPPPAPPPIPKTPTAEQKALNAWGSLSPPFTETLKAEWLKLCGSKKWKGKEQTAIDTALKRISGYEEAFALELIESAISGGYQGLTFPNTDDKYQQWVKNKNKHHGTQRNHIQTGPRDYGKL